MDAFYLQKELAKEIKKITDGMYFADKDGKQTELNVYEQRLPYNYDLNSDELDGDELDGDERESFFPFAIVRLENGKHSINEEDNTVTVTIIIGVRDDDPDNSGEKQIIGVIQRIMHRFAENNILKCFTQYGDITWTLETEDNYPYDAYPYSFGGMALTFQIPKIEREENDYT